MNDSRCRSLAARYLCCDPGDGRADLVVGGCADLNQAPAASPALLMLVRRQRRSLRPTVLLILFSSVQLEGELRAGETASRYRARGRDLQASEDRIMGAAAAPREVCVKAISLHSWRSSTNCSERMQVGGLRDNVGLPWKLALHDPCAQRDRHSMRTDCQTLRSEIASLRKRTSEPWLP